MWVMSRYGSGEGKDDVEAMQLEYDDGSTEESREKEGERPRGSSSR